MRRLHTELLTTTETTLRANTNAEDLITEPIRTQPHALQNTNDMYDGNGKSKRRQHLCKVWRNGTAIPAHLKKRIRFRKRKRGDEEKEDSS
ncbi:hypothetical protein F442_03275 [Phytophthora nicotianae P10297]|uniref:Uncharacterized protein n=1 Tax=Phytophthora nicotianae P10297 TaxID=1317064 RepID=W2ZX63_PHYNI|nr:hypothetical protein F442_03275 [Phytophthora nicotianae P10297]